MRLRSVLSSVILFLFSVNTAFAEDALTSLQQDVVLGKQKHQELIGKLDSARLVLDNNGLPAENIAPEEEPKADLEAMASAKTGKELTADPTESFKDKFGQVPARRVVTAIPAIDEESPLAQLDITPARDQSLVDSAQKKLWRWPKFDFLFPDKNSPKRTKPHHGNDYSPTPLTEGDAIYKVAISDGKITVEEAVEIGTANNVKLQAAKKNIELMDAKLNEAKRAMFPTVQAQMEINGGKIPGTSGLRFYKGKNQRLNVTQPLYYGGELANTVKQAEENIRSAKAEYQKATDDLVHQIRVAFYGVVKAEYNTEYQLELYDRIAEVLEMVKRQKDSRVIAEIDFLNVESQYYQALYQVETTKNDVLSANVSLKQAINLEVEGTIPVDLKMNFVKVHPDMKSLMNRAFLNNSDIRVKAFALESARYGIDIYESKKKPHVELRGSYGMLGETFHDDIAFEDNKASIDPEKEWFLGVKGSVPLGANTVEYEQTKHKYGPTVLSLTGSEDWKHTVNFNLFDKLGAITDEKQAQYALLQAESEYKAVKDEVGLRLRDEYYSLQRFLIQIDSSIAKLRYQNKQIAILEYMMNMQETTPSNYIENLISQVQDRYAFIQSIADYNVALSSIGLLIGDPFYFENQRAVSSQKYEASDVPEAKVQ